MSSPRYAANALVSFARELLTRAGLDVDMARDVAEILVEGDLLGHTTHGIALLAPYLADIEQGKMTKSGAPRVVADFPAAVTWDGGRLPGAWLTRRAFELAIARAAQNGAGTVVIRRSHHIGCLAAYLRPIAEQGYMAILTCSDPNVSSVAPHGGRRDVFTPNPVAATWPTNGDPVVLDVSMSIATNAMTNRLRAERKRFPGKWALSATGEASDDPQELFNSPPGSLLPMGGVDHGHKGYALALLVEALTGGLGGHGRADPREGWGASVFIEVFVPALFGGEREFRRETERVAELCRTTPARPGVERVRLPGEAGQARRREQLEHGIELYPAIMPTLKPWAEKLSVNLP